MRLLHRQVAVSSANRLQRKRVGGTRRRLRYRQQPGEMVRALSLTVCAVAGPGQSPATTALISRRGAGIPSAVSNRRLVCQRFLPVTEDHAAASLEPRTCCRFYRPAVKHIDLADLQRLTAVNVCFLFSHVHHVQSPRAGVTENVPSVILIAQRRPPAGFPTNHVLASNVDIIRRPGSTSAFVGLTGNCAPSVTCRERLREH